MKTTALFFFLVFLACALSSRAQIIDERIDLLDTDQQHVILTTRGDVLLGRIIGFEVSVVRFEIYDSEQLYELSEIAEIVLYDETFKADTYDTFDKARIYRIIDGQYQEYLLLSPTGFPYRRQFGETYFKNGTLGVEMGITDRLSVGVHSFLLQHHAVRAKYVFHIADYINLGWSGAMVFTTNSFSVPNFGLTQASLSLGNRRQFLNIGLGAYLPINGSDEAFGQDISPLFHFGGSIRMGKRWLLQSDNIVATRYYQEGGGNYSISAGYLTKLLRLDFGVFINDNRRSFRSANVVLPMIGLTGRFGPFAKL